MENILKSWLEANSVNRLSTDEEIILSGKIQKWVDTDKQLQKEKRPPTKEEAALINDGKEAYNRIVEFNVPLGIHFAKKYAAKYPDTSLTVDDLTQEAIIGIMTAAKKFMPGNDCKFSTYAAFWINQVIRRALEDKGDMIRKPASAHSRARKVHKAEAASNKHLSAEEIAETTGLDIKEVEFIQSQDKTHITSIDQNIFEDDGDEQSFHETIPGPNNINEKERENYEKEVMLWWLRKAYENQNKWDEYFCLKVHYGLVPEDYLQKIGMTEEEVYEFYGYTKTKVKSAALRLEQNIANYRKIQAKTNKIKSGEFILKN
ncbi:MAG: sigma-70 family RNA polymerase sigma factor [Anaerolineaceae bacterium]|nr:sigma-70 family RNA polymerase sigma factor [Anaerolineaceae bacterium]